MDIETKRRILNNPYLFLGALIVEKTRFYFFNRKSIKGQYNLIQKPWNSIFRKVYIKIKGNSNQIIIGEKCRLRNVKFEVFGNNNHILLSDKTTFIEGGCFLIEGDNCKIEIGKGSLFVNSKFLAGESNTKIEIGENGFCGIVTFSTSDFHSIIDLETGNRINKPDNIKVGRNIWMANDILVNKGAIISDNSVVASNSIVNKKYLQENVILAGQPAKIVKEKIHWSREKLR
jgi:acetyltransferase-like isoleucine patch superfamily enzyme